MTNNTHTLRADSITTQNHYSELSTSDRTLEAEIDRFFDDSTLSTGEEPQFVVICGGVASGKTTLRKQSYSRGFVLIDAAEIFLNLGGKDLDFPSSLEEPMNAIGKEVTRRAIAERRHIVTELIGHQVEVTPRT